MIDLSQPDLTQYPPRSPRVRLGGCVHLPRLLDKARAFIAGKNGEYHYECPLDKMLLEFLEIDSGELLMEVKKGGSDTQMLAWVVAKTTRKPFEISSWSAWMMARGPGAADSHEFFSTAIKQIAPDREDIQTIFDRLDLDDYVAFGGKS
jgi:hypothetical protein